MKNVFPIIAWIRLESHNQVYQEICVTRIKKETIKNEQDSTLTGQGRKLERFTYT